MTQPLTRESLGAFYLLLSITTLSFSIYWLATTSSDSKGWVIALTVFLGLWFVAEMFMLLSGLRRKGLNRQGFRTGLQGVYEVG